MRWVILFFSAGCALVWDGWYNGGRVTDEGLRYLVGAMSWLTAYFR